MIISFRCPPQNPIKAPIYKLGKNEAFNLMRELFYQPPPSIDNMLNQSSWTCAVIENLKVENLSDGRLMWVLGNGMPLRPDFAIKVNEVEVQSRLNKQAVIEWNFGSNEIVDAIENPLARRCDEGRLFPPYRIRQSDWT